MKPYGLKYHGSIKNSHFPHGPSCAICAARRTMFTHKHRSQKKAARRWSID